MANVMQCKASKNIAGVPTGVNPSRNGTSRDRSGKQRYRGMDDDDDNENNVIMIMTIIIMVVMMLMLMLTMMIMMMS